MKIRITVLILLILMPFNYADSFTGIFDIADIKPGQKGHGLTVFQGNKPESFDITVISLLENKDIQDANRYLGGGILIKTSGQNIQNSGGISAGMSGSPIFIDDKLLGGLSSVWLTNDKTIGMVVPISEMLKLISQIRRVRGDFTKRGESLWELSDIGGKFDLLDPFFHHGQLIQNIELYPVGTPVVTSGLGEKAGKRLIKSVPDILPISSIPSIKRVISQQKSAEYIQPGASIGVQIVKGDINILTIGTHTCRVGDLSLSFAHPAYRWGSWGAWFVPVEIIQCFPGLEMPFKFGVPGLPMGTVLEDRDQGVLSRIGPVMEGIPIRVITGDLQTGKKDVLYCEIGAKGPYIKELCELIVVEAVDSAFGRKNGATMWNSVDITFLKNNEPTRLYRRESNWTEIDPQGWSADNLGAALELLLDNEFVDLQITGINCEISYTTEQKTERILSATVPGNKIKAGSSMVLTVENRTYRKGNKKYNFPIKIPEKINTGEYFLEISGGWSGKKGSLESSRNDALYFENLESQIKSFCDKPSSSEMIVSLTAVDYRQELTRIKVDGVVEGLLELPLEVKSRGIP